MINNVVLVGRMTRDAELRYTQSNQAVATFTLAVNRNFKNQNGEREADFVTEVIANSFQLLESRSSQNQSGNFQNGNSSNYGNANSMSNFNREAEQTSFFQGNTTNPMDISDDDLPF